MYGRNHTENGGTLAAALTLPAPAAHTRTQPNALTKNSPLPSATGSPLSGRNRVRYFLERYHKIRSSVELSPESGCSSPVTAGSRSPACFLPSSTPH